MQPATGLFGQFEVLNALILREIKTRFGASSLGYLWALIGPSLWIGTFVGMFYMLDRTAPAGMDTVSFIATGLIPYTLFRETAARAVSAIGANKGLLFYPQIQPLDLVMARIVLEFVTMTLVFAVIIFTASMWQGDSPRVADWLQFVIGFAAAAALGGSLGLVLVGLSVFTPAIERLQGPLLRPLFWFSGIFYTANGLPPVARDVMLYNPVLHVVEFVRSGWFVEYRSQHASISYVCGWIVSLTFVGLLIERAARRRLELA
ncbi:MAG TPA: ABC transporter permease [Polyangiaceae bacterium]|nr:ABC transporter permease [Polyangiaceae bacterium]